MQSPAETLSSSITKKLKISKEALYKYARVHEINRTDDRYLLKLQEEMGELTQSYISFAGHGRNRGKSPEELKQSFSHELGDVMGHLLLLANHFDIDIEKALEEKRYKHLE